MRKKIDLKWMTPKEVGDTFGVNIVTVRKWKRENLIPSVSLPGSGVVRYPRAEIEEMAKQSTIKPIERGN